MIELEFIGAAGTVTGSKHLLRTSKACVLLDCGLFQGPKKEANVKNHQMPIHVGEIDAVVLSHAHIDHSGALPILCKSGYRGPIYSTPATRDLCSPMLMDTAWLMRNDAEHIRRLISRGTIHPEVMEPLYDQDDVTRALSHFVSLPYEKPQEIAPGVRLTFLDAGHVLGSAISVLDISDSGCSVRLAFTGDLGRKHLPILREPQIPAGVTHLMMESTYGDRLHDPIELSASALAEVVISTHQRRGKIVIPSFALERAQEVIFELRELLEKKRIPPIPVYVDSPLTVKLTDIFKLHPECYNNETFLRLHSKHSLFDFQGLHYISDVEDSKRISLSDEPCLIISASGMCEGGRILHHLQATIEDPKNTVLIVGYQAEHTLGRALVEHHREVRIFGDLHSVKAQIRVLNGFSGHADQMGLLKFAEAVHSSGSLQKIILVHGEPKPQAVLAELMKNRGFNSVEIPRPGSKIKLI